MRVKVKWEETWARTAVVDVDEDSVRDWLALSPIDPVTPEGLRRYLDHEFADICDDTTWQAQVGNLDLHRDEFITLDVDEAEALR